MDYKQLLENFGIHTRLGACGLQLHYDYVTADNKPKFEAEFGALARSNDTPISRYTNTLRSKLEENEEIIFDLLVEIYKRLNSIENMLKQDTNPLLTLEYQTSLAFIGHEVLCVNVDSPYIRTGEIYARLLLPIIPERHIGIFAQVLHPQVAQIKHLHIRDSQCFDSFVVECERTMILDKKSLS